MVLVSLDFEVVCPSEHVEMPEYAVERGCRWTPHGVPWPWERSATQWPTSALAELGYGRAPIAELLCWGARGSATPRRLVVLSHLLGPSGFAFSISPGYGH